MSNPEIALMGHLMRRAGFGAPRGVLGELASRGYEAVVEDLLNPTDPQSMPEDIIRRYHPDMSEMRVHASANAYWMYRMITSRCQLEEKLALFYHGLFATSYTKLNMARSLLNQIDTFRENCLGSFRTLLIELSKDPAMIIWLDNNSNHKDAVNENYGRELLELFSMGEGNYTEEDVRECARAFTGWTLGNAEYMAARAANDSTFPYGRIAWHFQYRDYDHDGGVKTFLGETGRFNGEDIIDIIVKQEATARFICTRLFQYFAADEIDEDGQRVIQQMTDSYFQSDYEVRSVMRTLLNSDYFKSEKARFARVKGPIELVVGAIRLAGSYQEPTFEVNSQIAVRPLHMGQGIFQPPSVEGWHEGIEWIESGSLGERINFAAKELGDVHKPGVRAIIERLELENGGHLSPEQLVDWCLDMLGPLSVSDETRTGLVWFAAKGGDLHLKGHQPGDEGEQRVSSMLSLVASTREFQLA